MTESELPAQQATRALADGVSSLASLLDEVDGDLAECASVLSQCETALVGISRGAAIPPDVLQEQAAAAKAAQLLVARLRSMVAENQRGIEKAMRAMPTDSQPAPR